MRTEQQLYSTAIHEAAHLVTQVICEGSQPEAISIIEDGDCMGYVRDSTFATKLVNPEHLTRGELISMVISLLSGYAAETIWTGNSLETLVETEIEDSGHDFSKAADIVMGLVIEHEQYEEQTGIILDKLFDYTVEFLQTPAVWSAITLVADKLMVQKEIDQNNGLVELIEEVLKVENFAEVSLIAPTID